MNRLRRLRYEKGATALEVAAATGISRRTLDRYEDPECDGLPTAPVAKALADYYGVPMEAIWPDLAPVEPEDIAA